MGTPNPNPLGALVADILRDSQRARVVRAEKNRLRRRIAVTGIGITAATFWWAQVVVWGLALFHVSSGYWGPWFLIYVFETGTAAAIAMGLLYGHKNRLSVTDPE